MKRGQKEKKIKNEALKRAAQPRDRSKKRTARAQRRTTLLGGQVRHFSEQYTWRTIGEAAGEGRVARAYNEVGSCFLRRTAIACGGATRWESMTAVERGVEAGSVEAETRARRKRQLSQREGSLQRHALKLVGGAGGPCICRWRAMPASAAALQHGTIRGECIQDGIRPTLAPLQQGIWRMHGRG